MGKKRIIKKQGDTQNAEMRKRALSRIPKKKMGSGVVHVQSTYNNTRVALSDPKGNVVLWSSSGALGFKGAKKGTPYAASKVAELVADKAKTIGVTTVNVSVKGVGAGRESAIRTFISKGFDIGAIRDITPIPHNGPRQRKPRRA